MSDYGKSCGAGLSRKVGRCGERRFSSTCLFIFTASKLPVVAWLAAAVLTLLVMLQIDAFWLPLMVSLVFLSWAWSSFERVRRQLQVYPEGMTLRVAHLGLCTPRGPLLQETRTDVAFGDVTQIDLRGPDLRVVRQAEGPPLVLLKGLSTKNRHQLHHRLDVQQRRGQIPAAISLQEPRDFDLTTIGKVLCLGFLLFWALQALTFS